VEALAAKRLVSGDEIEELFVNLRLPAAMVAHRQCAQELVDILLRPF
jgi:hypothetical protein